MWKRIFWLSGALFWCAPMQGQAKPQLVPQHSLNMDWEGDSAGLRWSPDGSFLSVGAERQFRILTREGALWAIFDGTSAVKDCDWSPDSKHIALTRSDGVSIVDVKSAQVTHHLSFKLPHQGDAALWGRWLPTRNEVAIGTGNSEIWVWHPTSDARRKLTQFRSPTSLYGGIASPDGKTLGVGGVGGVRLLDAVKGGQLKMLAVKLDGRTFIADTVNWSPNGRLMVARVNREIVILDATSLAIHSRINPPVGLWYPALEINNGGQLRAFDGDALARRVGDQWVTVHRTKRSGITQMGAALAPDGKVWVLVDLDGSLAWHDGQTGRLVRFQPGLIQWANALAWSPDGNTLAVGYGRRNEGGRYDEVELFDARTGRWQVALPAHHSASEETAGIDSVAWSPDSRLLVSSSNARDEIDSDQLRFWDGITHRHLRDVPIEAHPTRLRFSADGRILLCAGDGGEIFVWKNAARLLSEAAKPDLVLNQDDGLSQEEQFHSHDMASLAISPDNRILLTGSGDYEDGIFRAWDLTDGQSLSVLLKGPTVGGLAISADGHRFYTGNAEGEIAEWDLHTLKPLRVLSEMGDYCSTLLLSPDGRLLAAARTDWGRSDITLFSLPDGAVTGAISGPASLINEMIFSPDGRLLAAGDNSGNVTVWNVAKRSVAVQIQRLRSWRDKSGAVHTRSITLTPGGHYVASPNTETLLRWRSGDQLLSAEQTRRQWKENYADGEVVARALQGE